MKKINYFLWYFPICFFLFITIYICVKFIFIFFFRASYEPEFIYDLTPYYILSGTNNLQLLFLSIIVLISNVFLHIKLSKKNLLFSFLSTGTMLAGLGLRIATEEIAVSNFFHYLIFWNSPFNLSTPLQLFKFKKIMSTILRDRGKNYLTQIHFNY